MKKALPSFVETDSFILMAIACEQQAGGADEARIRNNVDGIERIGLTDEQLQGGLDRLRSAGYIGRRGKRHALRARVSRSVPRTAKGSLSLQRRNWNPHLRELRLPALFV
jgi:hypothetical protein